MTEPYTVQDLISLSYEQKPVEFNDAFNSLIANKITAAIDNHKVEVAQSMFASPSDDYEVETDSNDQYEEEEENGEDA